MDNLLYVGQWQGFFKYGPEYGEIVEGNQAEFRLFIEEYKDGLFSGRVIDWDGFGVNGEVASVNGFIDGVLISFTKEYSQMYTIDDQGNAGIEKDLPGHKVVYEGKFDDKANKFIGVWEISTGEEHTVDNTVEYLLTGTWEMHRAN